MVEILSDADGQFARNYNLRPFQFAHGLKGSPLFEIESLLELARRMPNHQETYWSNGKAGFDDSCGFSLDPRLSLLDTIANIGDNSSLVIIKHTEQDPVYGPVLKEFLARVVEFSGEQMRREVAVGEVLILIASPNRVTPYHIDSETNFVVQIAGSKTFSVFDHKDPTLVSDDVIERYHAGDHNSAAYCESKQAEATVYTLEAGAGVHVPPYAPHWARNHDNISVALSVNYELRSVQRNARIFKMNSRLRKLGLKPSPLGASPLRDALKAGAAGALTSAHGMLKRKSAPYPIWTPASS